MKFVQKADVQGCSSVVTRSVRTARQLSALRWAGLLLWVICASTQLFAQNSLGAVEGTITDPKGAVVPNALVNVLNSDTGVLIQTHTNREGFYSVPSLVPGNNYDVTVIKTGFQEVTVTGVTVQSTQTTTISSALKVGDVKTEVTVTSEGQMLSRDSSAVTTNMDEQLTDNLPYPEQGSLEVALLAPGVRGSQIDPSGLGSENPGIFIGNVVPGAQISINGATSGHSAILVDGADVTQSSYARAGITVSSGMAGQVTVVSNGVPAQYGRTMGGVVITSTKSGTNEYHGRIQWRHTDPMFQATPDGLDLPPLLHQNFFGVFLGGPIVIPHIYNGHNKTFFFAGFEPARFSNSTEQGAVVPLPEELMGNFNDDINLLDPTIVATQGYQAAYAAPRKYNINYQAPLYTTGQYAGFPNPNLAYYTSSTAYVPVPGNNLSAQLAANPFATFMAQQLPSLANPQETRFIRQDGYYNTCACPTIGQNAYEVRTVANVDNRWAFRIDHTVSSTDRMYLRYSNTPLDAQRTGLVNPSSPLNAWPSDSSHAYNILVDETHVFTSSLLNEFKVSYLRNKQNRLPPAAALTKDWGATFGLPSATEGAGFPSFTLAGVSYGTNQIFLNTDATSLLQDDFTIVRGRHKIMFGIDLRRLQSNQDSNPGLYGGQIGFSQNQTQGCQVGYVAGGSAPCITGGGVALASLYLGLVSSYSSQSATVPAHYRWQYYGAYVQDDFRILPKLTLNLGVRYEAETPRKEINDLQGTFVPNVTGGLNGLPAMGAFCYSGSCGLDHTIFPMNYKGIQPRIGIAWAPLQRLTVRSSFALLRVPLTGLSNTPVPNFGLAATSLTSTSGGVINNQLVDYITNPIASGTPSALTILSPTKGPFFTVPGNLSVPYIAQTDTVPYSIQWSFTLQYQILRRTIIEMGYNGSHGVHLFNNNQNPQNFPNINSYLSAINNGYNLTCSAAAPTAACPLTPYTKYSTTNLNLVQSLLPYSAFYAQSTELNELFNRDGTSSYNAMYVSLTHHFNYGLSLQASFTWSKSLDNDGADSANLNAGSGFAAALQNPFDRSLEKAVSDYDVPARTIIGYTYQIPFGKKGAFALPTEGKKLPLKILDGTINTIFGGWSTGGIARMESSTPYLPTLGRGTAPSSGPVGYWYSTGCGILTAGSCAGTSTSLPVGINPRPDLVPGIPCINSQWAHSGTQKFNTTYINAQAFTVPGYSTTTGNLTFNFPAFGNAPRTMANCRSPRQINFDMNLSKTIPIKGRERMNIVITAQAVNAFNHPLYFYNGSTTNNSTGNNGQLFTSYTAGLVAAPRTNGFVDNASYPFSLPPGFSVGTNFGTPNPGFTAQFSRVIQVGAAFNF